MKKILTAIMVSLTLAMSLFMAQAAELDVKACRTESLTDGTMVYYVTYANDYEAHEYQVSEKDFLEAAKVRQKEIDRAEKEEKRKASKPWLRKVIAWLTFWNPND